MFGLFLSWFIIATLASDSDLRPVPFSLPSTVTAGVPTRVTFSYTAYGPSCFDNDCNWPYFRLWLTADLAYKNPPQPNPNAVSSFKHFCLLELCISTNVTNFDIAIPPSLVGNGYPHTLGYDLFRSLNAPGSPYHWTLTTPNDFSTPSNVFNTTGGEEWTGYDQSGDFAATYQTASWSGNLTCAAFQCARDCAKRIEGQARQIVSAVETPNPDLDACVKACPGMGLDRTQNCVTKNAGPVNMSTSTGSNATPGTATAQPTTSAPRLTSAAPGCRSGQGLMIGKLVALFLIMTTCSF
jgi:hypothetical protein